MHEFLSKIKKSAKIRVIPPLRQPSTVSLRDRSRYGEILEGFSQSISRFINYQMHQTDRWSSIIRLRTYIDSGTQPDSRSTYMTLWLKLFAPISGTRSDS